VDLSNIKKGRYVKFLVDDEVQKYLFNLPNNLLKSSLKLTEEELEFAEKVGLNTNYRNKFREIFHYVTTHVANNTNDEIKTILNSFMSREDEFYSLINLKINRRFIISEESYLQLLYLNNQDEYVLIKSAMNIRKVANCQLIAPFFDLVEYKSSIKPPQSKFCLNFGLLSNNLIGGFSNYDILEGESIHLNIPEPVHNEYLYLTTGSILNDNPYDYIGQTYILNKTLINEDQVNFCHKIGCSGIDILKIWNDKKSDIIEFNYKIFKQGAFQKNLKEKMK
jgi:hypothetical protein